MGTNYIGQPQVRTDGRLKVTGQATYAGEFTARDLVYGYVVQSTIGRGRITSIDTSRVVAVPGVRKVFTHENLPEYLKRNSADYSDPLAPPGQPFRPLHDAEVLYNGQPIAVVFAETFEQARHAAALLWVEYAEEEVQPLLRQNLDGATREDVPDPPTARGDTDTAFAAAAHTIKVEYSQPRHFHNPMEPHATVAVYKEDGTLDIYDKIQGVASSQQYVCGVFGLDKKQVRVVSPFIGGAFGSGLRPQYQLFLAVLGATELKRPAQVTLTREQMFSFGHRPAQLQRFRVSTDAKGRLTSLDHTSFGETSRFEKYNETIVAWTGLMYDCENVKLDYQLVPVDAYTPNDMRAPGGVTGMWALESAMDEMANAAGLDPLAFRLLNYAERDQNEDKPFSSKALRECYQQCAERFGWKDRPTQPRSRQEGNELVGFGMATGAWEANQQKASARASFSADGQLTVGTATADIGTGTYTVMSQIAAETLGLPIDRVVFNLGDTDLPESPIEGGSWTVASVGSAVQSAVRMLSLRLLELAREYFPRRFKHAELGDVTFSDGFMQAWSSEPLELTGLLEKAGKEIVSVGVDHSPRKDRGDYSTYAHACVMVEVRVDRDLGNVRVERIVTAAAAGRIINPKTAENQILGAMVWGIGMALEEEGLVDHRSGRIMNANLAEYHVPVHADVQGLEAIFVEEHDEIVSALGAKGVGELGIVGVPAAIANAVYNATGVRVRELPITLDKLL
ncbi:xanthine dehydrogenase family protein molybdopterin-binding subunit [Lewinella sp. IMCC34183]|uniref:xanthine dehydrogenase family protein molybdopterin-binding subunit n=1 Tax=Lewinella sp. IMCC34183 TaxID=2248762 RepID=UPI000E268BFE|nr:xanthine dehydrogenase family protein molybdopterin-binding subunit [Lewinella sp. IMCC34183]